MIKDSSINYGSVTKILHWLMAALIILIFSLGYIMTNIPKSPSRLTLYDMHKATGLVVLCLFFLRLLWRAMNTQPKLASDLAKPIKIAAKSTRIVLYLLMFTIPLSGFLISVLGGYQVSIYYLFDIQPFMTNKYFSHFFANIHQLLVYVLAAAFCLHVIGALYHHFIIKDHTLKRMWFRHHDGESPL